MKGYTDLEQSKKLAEFLPLESADRFYMFESINGEPHYHPIIITEHMNRNFIISEHNSGGGVISWSLTALLEIIPYTIYKSDNEFYRLGIDKGYNDYAVWYNNNGFTVDDLDVTSDNFVDACVEMIIKLHEQKLL